MSAFRHLSNYVKSLIPEPESLDYFLRRSAFRLLRMTFAWATLGSLMGGYIGVVKNEGTTMLIAQTIAGIIVLTCVGLFLGCVFNRAIESLVGGSVGFLLGLAVTPIAQVNQLVLNPSVTLTIGALIGATGWPLISFVKIMFLKMTK